MAFKRVYNIERHVLILTVGEITVCTSAKTHQD